MRYGIADNGAEVFGRQVLTVWSGAFYGEYEARAVALPGGDGFMVTDYNGEKFRVVTAGYRDDNTWQQVDRAINHALGVRDERATVDPEEDY